MKRNLFDATVAWKSVPLYERINQCATMLGLHEFITDAQREQIHKKLMARLAKDKAAEQATTARGPRKGKS